MSVTLAVLEPALAVCFRTKKVAASRSMAPFLLAVEGGGMTIVEGEARSRDGKVGQVPLFTLLLLSMT